ncbi:MAG: hypothetical protein QXU32_01260 [Nitrososphaerales archaeon]
MSNQIIQNRVYFKSRFESITPELMVKGMWVSTALALILTIPALATFIGLYYSTGSVIVGALVGFTLHFATFAFATRITKALETLFD